MTEIRPQAGPQEQFLSSPADIAIYGGAAGGGKTWALLLEPLRHISNGKFGAVIFRRTSPQIRNIGGMWDESARIYPLVGGEPRKTVLEWDFSTGATIKFAHLQYDENKHDWQGAQVTLLGFDELTHFTEGQFFYMLSRNRSTCGIRPYVRATTNPDPDSWVAQFIDWWLNDEGYPNPERAGVLRWFVRLGDDIFWADSPEELTSKHEGVLPKSVTFIPAKLEDNPALMEADPGYMANLLALPYVDRMRLLGGNWKIRADAGAVFNRGWFETVGVVPAGGRECRFWDFAATKKQLDKPDPDFTAGVKVRRVGGKWYVVDVLAGQWGPAEVERIFLNTSRLDAQTAAREHVRYCCRWEIEPGSAGKREAQRLTGLLAGIDARGTPSRGDKLARAKPVAAQAEAGNILLLNAGWNDSFLTELHNQPHSPHDDRMDGLSGAFNELAGKIKRSARSYQG